MLLGPLTAQAVEPLGFVKGHSWGWVGVRGDYAGPEAAVSMQKLAATGADTVCIAFAANLTTYDNPHFTWGDDAPRMVSDDEVRRAVGLARENGLRVILKPTVNVDDGTWRAWIRFFRPLTEEELAAGQTGVENRWGDEPEFLEGQTKDLAKWEEFWGNFTSFLDHYARIAEETEADALCLGCEMSSTEEFVNEWRSAIARVRSVYSGPITYDINHGRENQLAFWDAVDFISVSGYYPTPPAGGATEDEAIQTTTPKAEIVASLERVRDELRAVSQRHGLPVLMIESGVCSVRGCARYPWTHPGDKPDSPTDQQEQAHYYAAFFEVFWDEPWFMGYAWWDWPARLYPESQAAEDRGFCVYGKQAESVLRAWYAKERVNAVAAEAP
ncbi:hypothetical protein Mal64_28960 [Pseudobythopirellula maris]|uniref:Uncharacterized protein n=2 Tax=Pseudobythopirellula maris TaxID=2527991 RepID=A0A5C5ZJY6_9BACT|nr:hypothetical protein Mal64_28960 [Pseudobythopirellula maris]